MSLRDFANDAFDFINTETLTDSEAEMLNELLPATYTREVFLNFKEILETRDNVSTNVKKLKHLFLSQGANVESEKTYKPKSNIFIGARL